METLQQQIITELGVKPTIDPEAEISNRVNFLVNKLGETGAKGYTLGISGGQDSLLAGIIAQKAVEKARTEGLDAEFHALLLPYGTQADRSDALLACEVIAPDQTKDIQIKPAVDAFAESFAVANGRELADFDKGNAKARVRMMYQYAVARENGLLVIGTDHAAEAVTGFFTKFGDGAADILPISGLNKRQGRNLLQVLGVPRIFTEKAPTADLLDAKPGQTDESELDITYDQLDDYLEGCSVPQEVSEKIEKRYIGTEHKRAVPIAYTGA